MIGEWTNYLILFAVGSIAGTLNVIAGGGSFLTLPVLIFLGLPATIANGTNRVGILMQSVGAVWGFHRYRVLDWHSMLWAALPATLGAVLGTWVALVVEEEAFQKILAFLMIAVTLWTLWDPLKRRSAGQEELRKAPLYALAFAFFGVGIYGGFVQAGVGFLILGATTLGNLDLVKGNAVKVLTVLALTVVSLSIFVSQGKVHWPIGFTLAAGTMLGGLLGVRLTVLKGHAWVKAVVTGAVIVLALKLWVVS